MSNAIRADRVAFLYSGDYELIGESSHAKSTGWHVEYRGGGTIRIDCTGSRQVCEEWLQDHGKTLIRQKV